jgi:extradiol dioxygenase family protein
MALALLPPPTDTNDDVYWTATHRTDYGHLRTQVEHTDDGVWSGITITHRHAGTICLSLQRDDWLAILTQCEQAIRYMDRLEGEINGR